MHVHLKETVNIEASTKIVGKSPKSNFLAKSNIELFIGRTLKRTTKLGVNFQQNQPLKDVVILAQLPLKLQIFFLLMNTNNLLFLSFNLSHLVRLPGFEKPFS